MGRVIKRKGKEIRFITHFKNCPGGWPIITYEFRFDIYGIVATECGSGVSCIVVSGYGTRAGGCVLYILAQMWALS